MIFHKIFFIVSLTFQLDFVTSNLNTKSCDEFRNSISDYETKMKDYQNRKSRKNRKIPKQLLDKKFKTKMDTDRNLGSR